MNIQEFVEKYVGECYSKIIKFIIVQLILEAVEIVTFIFFLLKEINEQSNLYITIAIFVFLLFITVLLNIKVSFGGLKAFVKNVNIYRSYSDAATEFQKTNDRAVFDKTLAELEIKIKEK